jgi:hypothetical protein
MSSNHIDVGSAVALPIFTQLLVRETCVVSQVLLQGALVDVVRGHAIEYVLGLLQYHLLEASIVIHAWYSYRFCSAKKRISG